MEVIGSFAKVLPFLASRKKECDRRKSIEPKRLAYKVCTEYLHGPWKDLNYEDFRFTTLEGGLTNKLYLCSLPEGINQTEDYPTTVLLRLYGLIVHDFKAQILQNVVFSILAERGIGPKLYAVFSGGRLEEYIPSNALTTKELSDHDTSRQVARRLAEIHQLEMPIKKDPRFMMRKLLHYWEKLSSSQLTNVPTELIQKFFSYDINKEVNNLKKMIEDLNPVVLFCHNDFQEGNLLRCCTPHHGKNIQTIDFEYSSYNFRGFDIANHFCEWMYDYSNEDPPYFFSNDQSYPNKLQQLNFISTYLESMYEADPGRRSDPRWSPEFVMEETNKLVLMSHLFWALWSVRQTQISDIKFGYMEYAIVRMKAYVQHKEKLQ